MGFILSVFSAPASITSYSDLSKLGLDNVPWTSEKKTCDMQCENGHKLCQNGGVCEVTIDCSFKCKCPDGYTGWFCDVKSPPVAEAHLNTNTLQLSSSTSSSPSVITTTTTVKTTGQTTLADEKINSQIPIQT